MGIYFYCKCQKNIFINLQELQFLPIPQGLEKLLNCLALKFMLFFFFHWSKTNFLLYGSVF